VARRPPAGYPTWYAYRNALAEREGWRSYAQKRWWAGKWTPEVEAQISAACWRHHATATDHEYRTGSLWPEHCNAIINARSNTPQGAGPRRPGTYQIRAIRHYVEDERRGPSGRYVRAPVRKARRTRIERAGVPVTAFEGRMEK
jgi:hypothetical protein